MRNFGEQLWYLKETASSSKTPKYLMLSFFFQSVICAIWTVHISTKARAP